VLRRTPLLVPMVLAALAACQDSTSPSRVSSPKPHFAQGDNGTWTVNTLADPTDADGVCDDVECTIREAIAAAGVDDKIVFANALQGTINLAAPLIVLGPGKSLRIDGADRITLNAQDLGRVLVVDNASVDLNGLTLTHGQTADDGGAIFVANGALTMSNSAVTNSHAGTGGGIFLESGLVSLINTTVFGNAASVNGGGIVNDEGSLTITESSISSNNAVGSGGGILNRDSLAVTSSTISANVGLSGAGIRNTSEGTATVVRSTIFGNSGLSGGFGSGIDNDGTLVLRSSTVSGNGGSNKVGGISVVNSATTVVNSIIAGNTGLVTNDCSAGGTSLGHNLTTTDGGCSFFATGDVRVASALVFTDVVEQMLTTSGGPTQTLALIARGRAVDAGYCPGESTDQRGSARPVDDPTMPNAIDACDIGAFERQGPPVADLMVSQTVDKTSVKQGELLTYFIRVRNLGPQTAPSVVVTDVLSSGVTFVKARMNKGTITAPPSGETGTVTWSLGSMLNGDNQVADIQVTVLVKGKTTVTNNASVTGNVSDPNKANDSAAITVSVVAGTTAKPRK